MHQEKREDREQVTVSKAVEGCLKAERDRELQPRTVAELGRYLGRFAEHCARNDVSSVTDLTPAFVEEYVLARGGDGGPALVKALTWSLRKLGGYLTLRSLVESNPAAGLRPPKTSPRAKLPEYLSHGELRQLLTSAARSRPRVDLVILSLIASTGLRTSEVAELRRSEVLIAQQRLDAWVKGGWRKSTPLAPSMAALLEDYLESRTDDSPAAFVREDSKPITVKWLQRMVPEAGEQAGLDGRLTCRRLRHTFGTHAADRHGKAVTKALLGHRRLATTEVYTHLSPRRFKALMNRHPYQLSVSRGGDHV